MKVHWCRANICISTFGNKNKIKPKEKKKKTRAIFSELLGGPIIFATSKHILMVKEVVHVPEQKTPFATEPVKKTQ